jgi:hypothetical protein
MASVFDTIKMKAGDTDRSNSWYKSQVSRIASGTTAQELFRQGKQMKLQQQYSYLYKDLKRHLIVSFIEIVGDLSNGNN